MRLKNYKTALLKRLEDPRYAAEYLARVLAEKDSAAFATPFFRSRGRFMSKDNASEFDFSPSP
jgi:DNA-binding phage protein